MLPRCRLEIVEAKESLYAFGHEWRLARLRAVERVGLNVTMPLPILACGLAK
jgi:hypothetical protein